MAIEQDAKAAVKSAAADNDAFLFSEMRVTRRSECAQSEPRSYGNARTGAIAPVIHQLAKILHERQSFVYPSAAFGSGMHDEIAGVQAGRDDVLQKHTVLAIQRDDSVVSDLNSGRQRG